MTSFPSEARRLTLPRWCDRSFSWAWGGDLAFLLCRIDDRLIWKRNCLSGTNIWCPFLGASEFMLRPSKRGNFAQWRYSNQWSNREVLLLLVENYTQYPAPTRWNTLVRGNFWLALRGLCKDQREVSVHISFHQIGLLNRQFIEPTQSCCSHHLKSSKQIV